MTFRLGIIELHTTRSGQNSGLGFRLVYQGPRNTIWAANTRSFFSYSPTPTPLRTVPPQNKYVSMNTPPIHDGTFGGEGITNQYHDYNQLGI